jgi:subtilase family serine protease
VQRFRLFPAAIAAAAVALAPSLAHAAIIRPAGHGKLAAPAGAKMLGAVSRDATVHASVALAPRDPTALATYAQAVSTPGSSLYHQYLSVSQFVARFAPSADQVAAVRHSLAADGLATGPVSANGLTVPITAKAATVETAFRTNLRRFALPSGATGYLNTSSPTIDPSVAGLVQGIVGLDTVSPTSPRIKVAQIKGDAATATAGPNGCAAARSEATSDASYTTAQIADRYQLNTLYAAGDEGRGVTVAVYELEPFSGSDVAAFQSCFHSSANVSTVAVDGGAGSGSGSGEAAMDVEDVVGLAPQANVRVYEGPASGGGAYDTYARIVSDDVAKVVTTSWGLCESEEGASSAAAENTLFQEAAAQGQTILASSGDNGSNDCSNHRQSVDDPSSQPWVTGVGASTIDDSSSEAVWDNSYGATGGGVSSLWARPAYQTDAQAQTSTTCGPAGTSCREVPDVTADGDPNTGYVIYYDGQWNTMGGTSISTPTWAAIAALADASPACAGHPVGFANPALYRLASTAYAANFGDVTSGSNGYNGVPGYAATTGYDMASGLGTPNAASLVPSLCGDSVTLAAPAAQNTAAGVPQRLALTATSSSASAITYTASGLPTGLTIAPGTGAIAGTPTEAGDSSVTVTATDAGGASASASFAWVVTAAVKATATAAGAGSTLIHGRPQITKRALKIAHGGHARLFLNLRAGRYAPGITRVVITAPRTALRFSGSVRQTPRGVAARTATGRRAKATARVSRGRLTVTVARAGQLRIIGLPTTVHGRSVTLTITVIDAGGARTTLRVRV